MGTRLRPLVVLLVTALVGLLAIVLPSLASAAPTTSTTPFIEAPGTAPNLDTITDGASVAAPYNLSQGITNFNTMAITPYPSADLLPTFSFAGQTSSATPATAAATSAEPNVAVYPAQTGSEPFASGFAGSPGPLSGYCGTSYGDTWDTSSTSTGSPNETATPVKQPAGATLPFAPYYFPYITRNADGSLTGYFDWRPKDADEAIVSATSTDNGKTWTASGEALEQNSGYCPSADTNDDGEGHPYVASLGTGSNPASDLYTLQRAIGDYAGTSLDVFPVNASAANPLAGVPAATSVGVDPNTFATVATALSAGTGAAIPVSTLGGDSANGNSTSESDTSSPANTLTLPDPTALPSGAAEYEDLTQSTAGTPPPVITCTGTSGANGAAPTLTGCTNPGAITVGINDDLVEVIGTNTTAATVPVGPQATKGKSGPNLTVTPTSANTNTLTYLLNANAPNRYYVNGQTVYCTQANAEPTTAIQYCTTPHSGGVSVPAGTPIIADPVIPSLGSNYTGGPATQTNGLLAPDGIIGPLPASANSAWGEPSTGKVVLYTQKLVNYFIEGAMNGTVAAGEANTYTNDSMLSSAPPYTLSTSQPGSSSTLATGYVTTPGATATDYNISPFPTESETLPKTGSFHVYVGAETTAGGAELDTLTCTGWDVNTAINDLYNPNLHTIDLLGCTSANATDILNAGHQGNWVAGPGASIESTNSSGNPILTQIGEGKAITAANAQKLFSNNEDYEVVRAAYTTDGINFTDLGAISGSTSGAGSTDGAYTDISNPAQQYSPAGPTGTSFDAANPQGSSPTNGAIGSSDQVELRWPGARGTIVTNADGSIGMFLSGAWASDGDSDAFNQIFYTQSADGGKTWTVPRIIQSTDYTFSASAAQDASPNSALGVSAYYSGRAYDPTVVANPDGTYTLVFAGYRLPAPVKAAGTVLGTSSSAQYCSGISSNGCSTAATPTITETDPALYRNILTETLWQNVGALTAPTVSTGSASAVSAGGATVAGTVQTNEPDTSVAIVYGTSPTNLTQSTGAGTLTGSSTSQGVSGSLSGLSQGTTYYYTVQATNYSGTTNGSLASFTTTGTGPTTTGTTTPPAGTTTKTVTTPAPTTTVTAPGSIFTVTTQATSPTPANQASSAPAEFTTATAATGNQSVSVELPSTAICLAAPVKLKVSYQSTPLSGSHKPKLTFVHATLSIGGKVRATVKRTSQTLELSLKGLKRGTYTLKVISSYRDKAGKRTRTSTKTQNVRFMVC